jgi:hypothetical protein
MEISVPAGAHCHRWPGLREAFPVVTNGTAGDERKCYVLIRIGYNSLLVIMFWFLHST